MRRRLIWQASHRSTHLIRGDSLEIDASTCVVALFGRPRTAALHLNKGACSALKVLCPHSLPQGPLLAVAWLSIKAGTGGRRGPTPRSMAANTRRTRPGPQPRLPGQGDRGAVRPPARVRAVKTRANLGARKLPSTSARNRVEWREFSVYAPRFQGAAHSAHMGCWTGFVYGAKHTITMHLEFTAERFREPSKLLGGGGLRLM